MPKSKGHRFTVKEDRLAKKIMKEYLKKGFSKKRAREIGYATVQTLRNKMEKF